MNRVAGVSFVLALAACSQEQAPAAEASGAAAAAPAAESATAEPAPSATAAEKSPLVNKIWVRNTGAGDLPGAMLVFLDDGTLIQDSCWETYRLSEWSKKGGDTVAWNEDGMEISADVVAVDDDDLTLRLNLVGGAEEQKFDAAEAPFVCPDMPR